MEWFLAAVLGLILLFFAFQIIASIVCIARAAVIATTGKGAPRRDTGISQDSAGIDPGDFDA